MGVYSLLVLFAFAPAPNQSETPPNEPAKQDQATKASPAAVADPAQRLRRGPPPRPTAEPHAEPQPPPKPAPLPAGPSLAQCQRAATVRAQVAPTRARRWLGDARRSAALPDLDATWERRLGSGWRLDREVGTPDQLVDDHDAANVWRIKLSWQLDRAWFNPDELRAARAAADLERLRRELVLQVTQLYFDRARAWTTARDSPDPSEAAQARLAAQELDGLLSSITGLSFPAHPWQAPPPGPRI